MIIVQGDVEVERICVIFLVICLALLEIPEKTGRAGRGGVGVVRLFVIKRGLAVFVRPCTREFS